MPWKILSWNAFKLDQLQRDPTVIDLVGSGASDQHEQLSSQLWQERAMKSALHCPLSSLHCPLSWHNCADCCWSNVVFTVACASSHHGHNVLASVLSHPLDVGSWKVLRDMHVDCLSFIGIAHFQTLLSFKANKCHADSGQSHCVFILIQICL